MNRIFHIILTIVLISSFSSAQEKLVKLDLFSGMGNCMVKIKDYNAPSYNNYFNFGFSVKKYINNKISIGLGINNYYIITPYTYGYLIINENSTINHIQYYMILDYEIISKKRYSLEVAFFGGSYFYIETKYENEDIEVDNPDKFLLGINLNNVIKFRHFSLNIQPCFMYHQLGEYEITNTPLGVTLLALNKNFYSLGINLGFSYYFVNKQLTKNLE